MFDLRVFWYEEYNPEPGSSIANIHFENIDYRGETDNPSRIFGHDEERTVKGVTFKNISINGKRVTNLEEANIMTNEFVHDVTFLDSAIR